MRDLDWSIFATDDKFDAVQGLALLTANVQKAIDSLAPDKKLNTKKILISMDWYRAKTTNFKTRRHSQTLRKDRLTTATQWISCLN